MKLITLKFSNLNALKGNWCIDFDDPAFAQNGIFAIIGDTGAGKTTILDAICLAIYGTTPRLDKITGGHNDIMNIQSSDCSAEVVLESQGKRYHFAFLQRRARDNPQGKLQDPKREISELDEQGTPTLLTNKLSQADKLSAELLGMDFNQFTRSVLLAQGKFNEFLSAKPEERGELLEKITGTQIYSQLGAQAYQTHKAKKEALNIKYARLHDIKTPSDDELASLHQKQKLDTEQKNTLTAQEHQLTHQLTLINDFIKTKQKHQEQQKNEQNARHALDDFYATHPQLTLAKTAQKLQSDFITLNTAHAQTWQSKHRLNELNDSLPTLVHAHQQAKDTLDVCTQALDNAHAQKNASTPIITEVHALETALTKLNEQHRHEQNTLTQLNTQLDQKTHLQNTTKHSHDNTKNHLTLIENSLKNTAPLATLGGELHSPLSDWQGHLSELLADIVSLKDTGNAVSTLRQTLEQQKNHLAHTQSELDTAQTALNTSTHTLVSLCQLTAFEPNAIKQQLKQHQEYISLCQNTQKDLNTLIQNLQHDDSLDKLIANRHTQTQLTDAINSDTHALNTLSTHLAHAQELYQKSKHNHELLLQIHALQSHLDQLTDGTPCPLCGSLSHPNKAQKQDDDALRHSTDTLTAQETACQTYQDQYNHALLELSQKQTRLSSIKTDFDELINTYQKNTQHQHSLYQRLSLDFGLPQDTDLSHQIHQLTSAIATQFAHLSTNFMDNVSTNMSTPAQIAPTKHALIENLHSLGECLADCAKHLTLVYDTLYQEYEHHQSQSQAVLAHQHALSLAQTKLHHSENRLNEHSQHTKLLMTSIGTHLDGLTTLNQHLTYELLPILTALNPALAPVWQQQKDCVHTLSLFGKLNKDNLSDFYAYADTLSKLNHPPLYGELLNTLQRLATAQKTHQEQQHEHAQSTLKLNTLQDELNALDQDIKALTTQAHACQTTLNTLAKQQKTAEQKRHALIGDVSLAHFEQRLMQAIFTAQSELGTAKDHLAHAQSELDTKEHLIKDETKRYEQHQAYATTLSVAFDKALHAHGFADLTAYESALLEDDVLANLIAQEESLTLACTLAHTQMTALTAELDTLAKSHLDHFGQDLYAFDPTALQSTLERQKADIADKLEHLLGTLGADGEKISHALESLAQKHALQQEIDDDEHALGVWAHLNELIGCSTGKTYRNYVQSLSLDVLLAHANDTLHKITDRYTLVQSQEPPKDTAKKDTPTPRPKATLGIEVIDHYQGNQIRSSKNLSGGESFIASLALALGLSSLNSQKGHIGSLFLDEGFGTLDEDALDTALTALSKIEQSGKTIGIISHVPALKERISTQIIAQKHSGGVSILTGAGVSRG